MCKCAQSAKNYAGGIEFGSNEDEEYNDHDDVHLMKKIILPVAVLERCDLARLPRTMMVNTMVLVL